MNATIIEEESVAKAAGKAIGLVCKNGVKIERVVGPWCMMKQGLCSLSELQNVVITITNPLKRWNSRVKASMLTETCDYLLGLNPGFTHKTAWKFYKQWIQPESGKYPYTYGERVFGGKDEINQWEEAVKMLNKERTTRHAHITLYRINDLHHDFAPCNFAWHFQLDSQGKLNMTTFCRSQDALRGLFLDFFAFTHFLEQMALATDLPIGRYTVCEANLHIYSKDLGKVNTDFGQATEPYSEGITPTHASLLTKEDKKVIYELLWRIFERRETPKVNEIALPSYWKDWIIFIAAETLISDPTELCHISSEIESKEILWALQKTRPSVISDPNF